MHSTPNNQSQHKNSGKDWSQVTYVQITDQVIGAFTIQMPMGWQNKAYLHQYYGLNRPIAISTTTDGQAAIYISDPEIPLFMEPASMADPNNQWLVNLNPTYRVAAYVPAEYFFTDYIQRKFGQRPGFRIVRTGPNAAYHQMLVDSAKRHGANFYTTTVSILFEYVNNGERIHDLISGSTISTGSLWIADMYAVSAKGDPESYQHIGLKMLSSIRMNPQWQQHNNNLHEQQMQSLRMSEQNLWVNHQQNMANLRMQSESHQVRMKNMQDGFQASNQQWMDNQRQQYSNQPTGNDYNHERFVNVIREEHTVMDQQGNIFQVDNKHERYYVNKLDGTYIGTDNATGLSDLGRTQGIDIRNYEEVKIIK